MVQPETMGQMLMDGAWAEEQQRPQSFKDTWLILTCSLLELAEGTMTPFLLSRTWRPKGQLGDCHWALCAAALELGSGVVQTGKKTKGESQWTPDPISWPQLQIGGQGEAQIDDSTDGEREGEREGWGRRGRLGSGPHLCVIIPEGLPVDEPDLCSVSIPADLKSELFRLHISLSAFSPWWFLYLSTKTEK